MRVKSRRRRPLPGPRRDTLANERTFLSWVRLAIAISALGFVIARFGIFLAQIAIGQRLFATSLHLSPPLGITVILLGPVIVLFAARRFFQVERELETGVFEPHYGMIVAVVILAVIVGILLAIDAVVTWSDVRR
jgi:putative membrane protein